MKNLKFKLSVEFWEFKLYSVNIFLARSNFLLGSKTFEYVIKTRDCRIASNNSIVNAQLAKGCRRRYPVGKPSRCRASVFRFGCNLGEWLFEKHGCRGVVSAFTRLRRPIKIIIVTFYLNVFMCQNTLEINLWRDNDTEPRERRKRVWSEFLKQFAKIKE